MKKMAMLLSLSMSLCCFGSYEVIDFDAFRNALDRADMRMLKGLYKKHEKFQGLSVEQKRSAYTLLHEYAQKIVHEYENEKMRANFAAMRFPQDAVWVVALALNVAGSFGGLMSGGHYFEKVYQRYRQGGKRVNRSLMNEFAGVVVLFAMGLYSTYNLITRRVEKDYGVSLALECEDFFKNKLDELSQNGAA